MESNDSTLSSPLDGIKNKNLESLESNTTNWSYSLDLHIEWKQKTRDRGK